MTIHDLLQRIRVQSDDMTDAPNVVWKYIVHWFLVNELSIFRKVYGNWELPKRNPETLKTSVETIFLPIQAHPMLCLDNKLHQVITMYEDKIPVDFVEGLIRYLKDNCWYYTDVNAPKITFVVNFVVSENDRNELIRNRVEIVDLSLMALPGLEVDWGSLNVLITEFFIRSSIVEANESPDTEIAKQIARLTIPNAKMLREHMLALSTHFSAHGEALSNSQRRGQLQIFENLLKKAYKPKWAKTGMEARDIDARNSLKEISSNQQSPTRNEKKSTRIGCGKIILIVFLIFLVGIIAMCGLCTFAINEAIEDSEGKPSSKTSYEGCDGFMEVIELVPTDGLAKMQMMAAANMGDEATCNRLLEELGYGNSPSVAADMEQPANSSLTLKEKPSSKTSYEGCDGFMEVIELVPTDGLAKMQMMAAANMGDEATCNRLITELGYGPSDPTEVYGELPPTETLDDPYQPTEVITERQSSSATLGYGDSSSKVSTPTLTPTLTPVPTNTIIPTLPKDTSCGAAPKYHTSETRYGDWEWVCTCEDGIWRDCTFPTPTPFPTLAPIIYAANIQVSSNSNDIGDYIELLGWNFIPNTWISHFYDLGAEKIQIGSSLADSSGNFSERVRIPDRAPQGKDYKIMSSSDEVTATIVHNIKPSKIKVSKESASKGEELTITGNGLPADIGARVFMTNIPVAVSPTPRTDSEGNLQVDIIIPRVPLGDCLIEVKIANKSFLTYILIE